MITAVCVCHPKLRLEKTQQKGDPNIRKSKPLRMLSPKLCVWVCGFVFPYYACMHLCVQVHMSVEAIGWHQVWSLVTLYFIFLMWGLSLNLELTN